MQQFTLNKYSTAAIFLFAAGGAFTAVAVISNPGEITTSAFVIAGLVFLMTGILTLAFFSGERAAPRPVGLLPAQGSLDKCLLTMHLGYRGNAYFLPPRLTGKTTVFQYNPISTYDGKQGRSPGSFKETGPAGLVSPPSCDLLIEDLRENHALVIPDTKEELTYCIRETIEDFFKFCPRVSVQWEKKKVTITFHDYPYIDGCKVIAQKSSSCCSMSPCPVCSLCGALIAEGLDTVVSLEHCSVNPSSQDITAVFSLLP